MTLGNAGKVWLLTGSVCACLSVVLGAFGAHGLTDHVVKTVEASGVENVDEVVARRMDNWETGAKYQMYHAIGILVLGLICHSGNRARCRISGWLFVMGILLFSGALYVLVLTGMTWLGAIAPIGGTAMIAGWLMLGAAAWKSSSESDLS